MAATVAVPVLVPRIFAVVVIRRIRGRVVDCEAWGVAATAPKLNDATIKSAVAIMTMNRDTIMSL